MVASPLAAVGQLAPYDALLVVSFGGPEGPDDVMPFLERVTAGRGVPPERLAEVAEHYYAVGGVSPITAQNRAFVAAVEADLCARGLELPVYWGNRNWHPLLADTLAQMAADGIRRAAVFVTAAYASYSGCRQYREDLARAAVEVAERTPSVDLPRLDKLRHYFDHPGFLDATVDAVDAALAQLGGAGDAGPPRLLFVTHSVPVGMAESSGPAGGAYVAQHAEVARLVTEAVSARRGAAYAWELVYCSRSGPPSQPWTEPDINDRLRELTAAGERNVVVVPIGFVSDHMEVAYDLDTEAAETAAELGLGFARAATVGIDPRFVAMVGDLVLERAAAERGEWPVRAARSPLGPSYDVCPLDCCPNLRAPRPALAGTAADAARPVPAPGSPPGAVRR